MKALMTVVVCVAATMAAPQASAAVDGTVRMDFGQLLNPVEKPFLGGVEASGVTGFIDYDITNAALLDAELVISGGGGILLSFDASEFYIASTPEFTGGVSFGLTPSPASKADTDYHLLALDAAMESGQYHIDLTNETGEINHRLIGKPGERATNFFNASPQLTFTPVPEPGTAVIALVAAAPMLRRRRQR